MVVYGAALGWIASQRSLVCPQLRRTRWGDTGGMERTSASVLFHSLFAWRICIQSEKLRGWQQPRKKEFV